jgi:zinc D-Ala-D-Ala carboxypeptidase
MLTPADFDTAVLHESAADAEATWQWGPYFTPQEFACRGTGKVLVVPRHMNMVFALREMVGFGMTSNSSYRDPDYDASVGGAGVHPFGIADDWRVSGARAHALLLGAFKLGFTGIGIRQKGPHEKRFIHLDNLNPSITDKHPRPWVWSY